MNEYDLVQLATLADNWLESLDGEDLAAAEAFEDELHSRFTRDQIEGLGGTRSAPDAGEPDPDEARAAALARMWDNASKRLD